MNEAETRAEHIDPALKEAGWGVFVRMTVDVTDNVVDHHGAKACRSMTPIATRTQRANRANS
ncbi:MAG: hypothetical protein ABIU29_06435 [Chthoniobacterales bacterium]